MNFKARAWAEIKLGTVLDNYRKIANAAKPAKVLSVLKANAYGMGAKAYAEVLKNTDTVAFGVAEPCEAMELLDCGKPIVMLSAVLPDEVAAMVDAAVDLPITDLAIAKIIDRTASKLHCKARVHVKLDSGMGRAGIPIAEARQVIRKITALENLDVHGLLTHCPMAANAHSDYTDVQADGVKKLLKDLATDGIRFQQIHMAASDAINNFKSVRTAPFNVVRAGKSLHGGFNAEGSAALGLKSVLTVKARIAQVRNLPAGTTLGYNRLWCLSDKRSIATITAGYADGVPLALTNRGWVTVNGVACPIVGRISMDYTMADVTNAGIVKAGDEVTLLGGKAMQLQDWATLKGVHEYEIICSLGRRVERVYEKHSRI